VPAKLSAECDLLHYSTYRLLAAYVAFLDQFARPSEASTSHEDGSLWRYSIGLPQSDKTPARFYRYRKDVAKSSARYLTLRY